MDLSCPLAREMMRQGPVREANLDDGIVVATDGSLKHNGSIGPGGGLCSLGRPSTRQQGSCIWDGNGCQTRAYGPGHRRHRFRRVPGPLLTDSKSSMDLLQSKQRVDFPLSRWLYRHPARQLLFQVAHLINRRAAAGVVTRLVKIKAHAGDPFNVNEAADALASAVAELDPTRSQDVDQEGVYFPRSVTGPSSDVEWRNRGR